LRYLVEKYVKIGLNPDPVDRSHPDVNDSSIAKVATSNETPLIDQNKSGIQ
jgi:hypothetical protein